MDLPSKTGIAHTEEILQKHCLAVVVQCEKESLHDKTYKKVSHSMHRKDTLIGYFGF